MSKRLLYVVRSENGGFLGRHRYLGHVHGRPFVHAQLFSDYSRAKQYVRPHNRDKIATIELVEPTHEHPKTVAVVEE